MAGMEDVFDQGVETLTESNANQVQVAAETTAPSNEPTPMSDALDSAVIERAMVVQAQPQEAAPEQAAEGAEEETRDAPSETPEVPETPRTRAEKRIKQLVEARNAANDRAAKAEQMAAQRAQELEQRIFQMQAQFQQKQLEIEQRRLQMEEARHFKEEEATLSDVEKARRQFANQVVGEAERKLQDRLGALEQELMQHRQWQQQLKQNAEQRMRMQRVEQDSSQALDTLLNEYDESMRGELREPLEEMFHTYAGAFRMWPTEAVPRFKEFIAKLHRAENSRLAKTGGAKVAAGQRVVRSAPTAAPGTSASAKFPAWNKLQAAGYSTYGEWIKAGSKPL